MSVVKYKASSPFCSTSSTTSETGSSSPSVVGDCALLLVGELLVKLVASGKSFPRVEAVSGLLRIGWQVAVECLARVASLLLADVTGVGPASHEDAAKEENQVALATVIERVRLVPVGEGARVLLSKRCLIAHFHVTVDSIGSE